MLSADVSVIECEGRLIKRDAVLRLHEAVPAQEDAQVVVLRLSAVHAIEGKSLLMLISLRRWARAHNIRFMLYDPSKCVREGVNVSGQLQISSGGVSCISKMVYRVLSAIFFSSLKTSISSSG